VSTRVDKKRFCEREKEEEEEERETIWEGDEKGWFSILDPGS
jgi:hypothetical protein